MRRPVSPPTPAAAPTDSAGPAAGPRPAAPFRPMPHPRPVEPLAAPAKRTWRRLTTVIAGDLAVHGLAYLGVLLLFTGIFGLVVFAFGDVTRDWRPMAEVATPLGLFGAAWYLHRRGVPFVADAMVVLAGAVVPVVFAASLSDGSNVPPDLEGAALVVGLATGCLAITIAYALVAARRPDSVVRYLILPTIWLGIAMASLATVDPIPTGKNIATPHPLQMSLVVVSIVATVVVGQRWLQQRARAVELACLVGYGVVYALVLLAAAADGWPTAPLVLSGLSGVTLGEAVADRLDHRITGIGQAVLVGATLVPFGPVLGTSTTAALVTIGELGLAEWIGWRRASGLAGTVTVVGAGVGLAFTLGEPGPALVAGALTWGWVLARRAHRPRWLSAVTDTAWLAGASLVPVIPATSVLRLTEPDVGLLVIASLAALIAVAARALAQPDDALWQWWPRAALVAIGVGTCVATANGVTGVLVAAALVVAAGLVIAPGPLVAAFWSVAAATVWAGLLVADFAGLSIAHTATGFGIVALALIGASTAGRLGLHLGLLGYLLAAGTLVGVAGGDWSSVAIEGLFTAGWILTLVRQERGHCLVLDRAERAAGGPHTAIGDRVRWIPAVVSQAGVVMVMFGSLVASGADPTWWPPAIAIAGALSCATARLVATRLRTATVFASSGFVISLAGVVALQGGDGRVTLTLAAAILAAGIAPAALRPTVVLWLAWMLFARWTVTAAVLLGLDIDQRFAVLLSWGAVVLIGTLVFDEQRAGRRSTGETVRSPVLLPPVIVAPAAMAAGLGTSFTRAPHVYGAWCLVVALVALVAALQLRAGLVTVVTYALAGVALGTWLPFDAIDVPWTIVLFGAVLTTWSGVLARRADDRSLLGRWDAAAAVIADASVAVALVASTVVGYVPATFLASAGVFVLAAGIQREPMWLLLADGLALVGAGALGPGWLSLALTLTSVAATRTAIRIEGRSRRSLQLASVAAASGAWYALLVWADACPRDATVSSTVLGGAVALGIAAGVRWFRLALDWAAVWLTAVALGIGSGFAVALATNSDALRDDALVALSAALAMTAAATALAARPLATRWLRMLTVVLAVSAAAAYGVAIHPTVGQLSWTSMVAGLAWTLVALALIAMRPASPWQLPWLAAGGIGAATSITAALAGSSSGSLEPFVAMTALLTAAAEAAAVGAATRSTIVLAFSPPLACAGWLVFAYDAFTGEPMWFGIPIGLALLLDTGLIRWRRRLDGDSVGTPTIVAMDDIGMVFVLGTPLIEAIAVNPLDSLIAIAGGAGVAVWGVVTRVRRRVLAGAIGVVLGVLCLIILPLVPLVPETTGPAVWTMIAAAGLLMIVAAASLEHGRARFRHGIARLQSFMHDWE